MKNRNQSMETWNEESLEKLGYFTVMEEIQSYARSYMGKALLSELRPSTDVAWIRRMTQEGEEARVLAEASSSIPVLSLVGMERMESLLGKGYVFSVEELTVLGQFLQGVHQLKRYMLSKADKVPTISAMAYELDVCEALQGELHRCLQHGAILDEASKELSKLRKQLRVVRERFKKKLESAVHKYAPYLQETFARERNGRWVIAVQKEHKKRVPGVMIDESASGQTVFIEPSDVSGDYEEIQAYESAEFMEEQRILSQLSGHVDACEGSIVRDIQVAGLYDALVAKARYAIRINGQPMDVVPGGWLQWTNGRHPLLGPNAKGITVTMGRDFRVLIVTGPNTGGKTVALKTVGLTAAMAQSGLLVAADRGGCCPLFTNVLVDIGDGQSLDQSLSTFSAHIQNILQILKQVDAGTLVLLDELATGTDPGEGVGLSIAVLEELHRKGALIMATTHYNEIKAFASKTPGFENARMEFDVETLRPLYKLTIGIAGRSYAFAIAEQLGIPTRLIERAKQLATARSSESAGVSNQIEMLQHGAQDNGENHVGHVRSESAESNKGPKTREPNKDAKSTSNLKYQIGDRVWIHAWKKSGILSSLPDDRGNVTVMVQKQPHRFNLKRISPYLGKEELYPDEYDLDIVLVPKEVRKARRTMRRRHVEGFSIDLPPKE